MKRFVTRTSLSLSLFLFLSLTLSLTLSLSLSLSLSLFLFLSLSLSHLTFFIYSLEHSITHSMSQSHDWQCISLSCQQTISCCRLIIVAVRGLIIIFFYLAIAIPSDRYQVTTTLPWKMLAVCASIIVIIICHQINKTVLYVITWLITRK